MEYRDAFYGLSGHRRFVCHQQVVELPAHVRPTSGFLDATALVNFLVARIFNGFVEIFTPGGKHVGHLEHGAWLNSPWGVVWTPRDFGTFSNTILVGNFGSGWIAAFNGFTYKFIGFVKNPDDSILTIDGLWALAFGNNGAAGPSTTLYFSAGPDGETHGLFGTLTPVAAENNGSIE
jgi:hypothetical protein